MILKTLPPAQLTECCTDSNLLDVRTLLEHHHCKLALPHLHMPLDQIDPESLTQTNPQLGREKTLYLLCRSGKRAEKAALKLRTAGLHNLCVIAGGLEACEQAGQAVVKTVPTASGPISLERQVRIAAGGFIIIGSLAALLWNTQFAALPLFVGCGLVFAGVTNRCGLALLLTKMPWNKIPPQRSERTS